MSTSMVKKISSNLAAALLVLIGLVNTAPASAITFKFSGIINSGVDDLSNNAAIEGTYTVNDEILKESLQKTEFNDVTEGGIEFLEFSLNGIPIFQGQPLSSEIITNVFGQGPGVGSSFFLRASGEYLGERFGVGLGFLEPATKCLTTACAGVVTVGGLYDFVPYQSKYDASGRASIQPESVPEPTTAIALGVASALMLIRQRKRMVSSSQ